MTHPTFASNALHVATGPGVGGTNALVRHKEIIRGNANVATERFVCMPLHKSEAAG